MCGSRCIGVAKVVAIASFLVLLSTTYYLRTEVLKLNEIRFSADEARAKYEMEELAKEHPRNIERYNVELKNYELQTKHYQEMLALYESDYESYANKFYLVAEILSDSNTDKDIAVKRQRYLQHADNLYFVLIEQKRVRLEVLARASGWQPIVLDRHEDTLDLAEFGLRIGVGSLYRGTPLAQPVQA